MGKRMVMGWIVRKMRETWGGVEGWGVWGGEREWRSGGWEAKQKQIEEKMEQVKEKKNRKMV